MANLRALRTAEFDEQVVAASGERPVLVDFWAPWCGPCQMLAPILEELAAELGDKLRIVKVNTDEEPDLANRFGIRGIPALKLFSGGRVVGEWVGVQPAAALRAALAPHLPRDSDKARQLALDLAAQGNPGGAVAAMREVVASDPDNAPAALDLARLLALAGRHDEAQSHFDSLPAAAQADPAGRAALAYIHLSRVAADGANTSADAAQAKRRNAARMLLDGRKEEALDEWLALMEADRKFARGAGKKDLLQAFELIGTDDPLLAPYRRRLAALLY